MQKRSTRADDWTRLALEQYLDAVYRLAYARTRSKQDAGDVAQEVLLKLCRCAGEIESEAHLKQWLIRVTVNECANLFRSPWRRRTLPLDEGWLEARPDAPESNDRLDAALAALNPDQRAAIHLFTTRTCPPRKSPAPWACASPPCGSGCTGREGNSRSCSTEGRRDREVQGCVPAQIRRRAARPRPSPKDRGKAGSGNAQ